MAHDNDSKGMQLTLSPPRCPKHRAVTRDHVSQRLVGMKLLFSSLFL
jgi:hypothetical protein